MDEENSTTWCDLNAGEKINLWKTLDFNELFRGSPKIYYIIPPLSLKNSRNKTTRERMEGNRSTLVELHPNCDLLSQPM